MKILYQVHIGGQPIDHLEREFEECVSAPEAVRQFALELARGVLQHQDELDSVIRASLDKTWDFERLASIDLELMRIGAHEILHHPKTPPAVAMDEAIEIAKVYSGAPATKFLNGVLDRIARERPPRENPGT